jgi:hypothetical protein
MKHTRITTLPIMTALLGAATLTTAAPTLRQYLSGQDKDTDVKWEFFCSSGPKSGSWTTIPVPSHWEFHGFGKHTYWADKADAPQGKYKYSFPVLAEWSNKRVFIVFEGVMTDTDVSINGQSAGPKHQGGFYRFKYDITKLVKLGQPNLLEVTVDRKSADNSVNAAERDADYWVFGGIYRPVYLEAQPQQFIDRVAIDAKADGSFAMDVAVDGEGAAKTVEVEIVAKGAAAPLAKAVAPIGQRVQLKVANPKLWSAETPNLYEAIVRLPGGHEMRQRFGFRTIEIKPGDGIYVNGMKVIFKGTCRHSFWPDSGRCLNRKTHELDVSLMKDMNMNAVRMSHYPPDQEFLDICDEQGLYVLNELAGWGKSHKPFGVVGYTTELGQKLVKEMVTRDVNHPSIILWDNGNEGGWNKELDVEFGKWDPQQRQVVHPFEKFGPLNTAHYPNYDKLQAYLSQKEIYFPTEFLHGLFDGGAAAGLSDFWSLMRQSKISAGGFIWALMDEGVNSNGKIDVVENNAPDGIVGPYRQKEGSFFAIKEIWSPVVVQRDGTVDNRYEVTNLRDCKFEWQLRKFRLPDDAEAGFVVVAEGVAASPDVAPGKTGKLALPTDAKGADALALKVTDPHGREVYTWVWGTGTRQSLVTKTGKASGAETADTITLVAGDTTVQISKATGELVSVMTKGKTFALKNGPRAAIGEATAVPTKGKTIDVRKESSTPIAQSKLTAISHQQDGNDHIVTAQYAGGLKSVTWRMNGAGWLRLEYAYEATGPKLFVGVTFDCAENAMKKLKWLGEGPYHVWKNRPEGVTLGVWENAYNDTETGKKTWIYPEFHGYFSNVRWAKLTTTEGPITMVIEQDDLFLRVLGKPGATTAGRRMGQNEVYPEGQLSIMHGIPAIGNKMMSPEKAGPSGQPIQATGSYTGSVSFRFGE